LFEPLFRRESSRHDAGAHLGIGLTLSLEAARAMGGDLTVAKSADGLEFTLAMPAVAVPA
jgi:signal transduction histidine kinase